MALYNTNSNMPQMAQNAMNSATQAMASQQKKTTTTTKQKGNIWDDIYKGARAFQAVGSGISSLVEGANDVYDLYDEVATRNAYDDIAKAYQEGGRTAIESNPDFQDFRHQRAYSQYMTDRASTAKGRAEEYERAMKMAEHNYTNLRAAVVPGLEAFRNGDMQTFGNLMVSASEIYDLPWKIQANKDGTFTELMRSNGAQGKFVPTGRTLTAQQLYDFTNGIMRGEVNRLAGMNMQLTPENREAFLMLARGSVATSDGNKALWNDPSKHNPIFDRNGNLVSMAVLQNPLGAGNEPGKFLTFDVKSGKSKGAFTAEELLSQGYRIGTASELDHMLKEQRKRVGRAGGGGGGIAQGLNGAAVGATGIGTDGKFDPSKIKFSRGPAKKGESDALHRELLASGYTYDKNQDTYFKVVKNPDTGKLEADISAPLLDSDEEKIKESLLKRMAAKAAGTYKPNDPDGIRNPTPGANSQQATNTVPQEQAVRPTRSDEMLAQYEANIRAHDPYGDLGIAQGLSGGAVQAPQVNSNGTVPAQGLNGAKTANPSFVDLYGNLQSTVDGYGEYTPLDERFMNWAKSEKVRNVFQR